jgi:arylsulfatase
VLNGIVSHIDMFPTLLAAAGDPSDDGELMAVRLGDWKLQFAVQRNVCAEPLVKLRVPHIFSLRRDPFERADYNSNTYWNWIVDHVPILYACQGVVAEQISSFAKFPPRQKLASFNLDEVLAQASKAHAA